MKGEGGGKGGTEKKVVAVKEGSLDSDGFWEREGGWGIKILGLFFI